MDKECREAFEKAVLQKFPQLAGFDSMDDREDIAWPVWQAAWNTSASKPAISEDEAVEIMAAAYVEAVHEPEDNEDWAMAHDGVMRDLGSAFRIAYRALAPYIPPAGEWRPIFQAKINPQTHLMDDYMHLAAFIVPSEEAQRHGAKPHWTYGHGREIYTGHFSGILGGKPSHFMPLHAPAPPASSGVQGNQNDSCNRVSDCNITNTDGE